MIKFHQVYSDTVVGHFFEVKASSDIFSTKVVKITLSIAVYTGGSNQKSFLACGDAKKEN